MQLEPLGMLSAMRALDDHFDSARYDRKPVHERPRRIRGATASALRRLADRIQPVPRAESSRRQHTCSPIEV